MPVEYKEAVFKLNQGKSGYGPDVTSTDFLLVSLVNIHPAFDRWLAAPGMKEKEKLQVSSPSS